MEQPDQSSPLVPFKEIATLWARRLQVECFPLVGKEPALGHEWRQKALGKAGVHEATPSAWEAATGFAIASPEGSLLVILDGDDAAFIATAIATIPTLSKALTVTRGDHCHLYLMLSRPLPRPVISLKKGKYELASLRGTGSYVVAPYSQHPSGDIYKPNAAMPVKLTADETNKLLALFDPAPQPVAQVAHTDEVKVVSYRPFNPQTVAALTAYYQAQGYKAHGSWLNGQCPQHRHHKNGDKHPSFGFNMASGIGYCFRCGLIKTKVLCAYADIPWPRAPRYKKPRWEIRQQRRAELIAQKKTQAVRIGDMLKAEGQSRYSWQDLVTIGKKVGWSKSAVYRHIRQAIEAGIVTKPAPNVYRLAERFTAPSPAKPLGEAYRGHPVNYRRIFFLSILADMLPKTPTTNWPKTKDIAAVLNLSPQTIYRYENHLGIKRLRVYQHSPLPTLDGPPIVPDEVVDTHFGWRKGYYRFEVVDQGETLIRVEVGDNPAQALSEALRHATTWGGEVVVSKALPSIRLLPGQSLFNLIPPDARLSQTLTHVIILSSPKPPPKNRIAAASACAKATEKQALRHSSDKNTSVLSTKSENAGFWALGDGGARLVGRSETEGASQPQTAQPP